MKQEYTLTIYTENQVGLINKIAIMFSRRKISLESLNTSPSEIENIYRFTIVVRETEEVVKNLVRQLEKIVDVCKNCTYSFRSQFSSDTTDFCSKGKQIFMAIFIFINLIFF